MSRDRRLPRCLRVDEWPADDQLAWARAQQKGDIFDGCGLASAWRSPTRRLVEQAVGRFLGWLIDVSAGDLGAVPDVASLKAIRSYTEWLVGRVAPVTVHGHIKDLMEYCRVAWPDWDRSHLHRAERSLAWRAKPSKDKQSRVVPIKDLFRLGVNLMTNAQPVPGGDPRAPLTQYRDGFAIAFLALRPLRIRAFASLHLGTHLVQVDKGWKIAVTPELNKTKRDWEADFPSELVPALEYYLDHVRPELLNLRGRWHAEPGRALWISQDGSPLKPKALAHAITSRTTAAFERPISPHLFRDCAATTLAYHGPEDVRLATPMLGHSNPKMTEKHYNQARQVDAGRKYLDALARVRRGGGR